MMSNYLVVAVILFLGCANCIVIKKPSGDDPCKDKEDGVYGTGDVFQYMKCKSKHASYVSCGSDLFDACSRKCVAPSEITIDNLCECRANGNCMYPWNCHKYVTCSNGYHYLFNCSRAQLVYDSAVDRCVQPAAKECNEVKKVTHVYKLVPQAHNWHDAQANCQRLGGNLATITSKSADDQLFALMTKAKVPVVWMGFNDIAVEGRWVWVGRKTLYTNWHKGEPNNAGDEDCGSIIKSWNGQWNDYSCTNKYASICEIPTFLSPPEQEPTSGLMKILDNLLSWRNPAH